MENEIRHLEITETPVDNEQMSIEITVNNGRIDFLARAIYRILECIEKEYGMHPAVTCGLILETVLKNHKNKEQENDE